MLIRQQRISPGRQFRRSILPLPSGSRTAQQKSQTTKRAIPVKTRNLRHSTGRHPVPRAEANKRPTPDYAHQALLQHLHCHMLYQIRWPADILCMRHVLTDPPGRPNTLHRSLFRWWWDCWSSPQTRHSHSPQSHSLQNERHRNRCGKPPCLGGEGAVTPMCRWWKFHNTFWLMKIPFSFRFLFGKSFDKTTIWPTNAKSTNCDDQDPNTTNFPHYKFPASKLQTRSRSLVSIERICFYGQHQQPGEKHPHRLTSVPQVSQKSIIGIKGFQLLWAESLSQICQGPFKNIYPPNRKDKRSLPVPPFFRDENVRLRGCQISKIEFLSWLETSKTWSPGTISKVASPSSKVPDAKLTFCV